MDRLIERLDHAWGQRQTLYTEAGAFLDKKPYRMWQEEDPDSGDYLAWIEPTSPVPPHLGFLAADCINNIRSCLDNLVSALPGADPKRSAFVVLDTDPSPVTFEKKAWRLKGIPASALRIIESLQPYQRTQNASGVNVPIGTLLLHLDELWNRDKHRVPTVALSTLRQSHVTIPRDPATGAPLMTVVESNIDMFDGRHVVFRLRRTTPNHGEFRLKMDIAIDIGLPHGPLAGHRADETITDLYNCVRDDILPLFAPYLYSTRHES